MSACHSRLAYLFGEFGLSHPVTGGEATFLDDYRRRVLRKVQRLRELVPGLSEASARGAIAESCAVPTWEMLEALIGNPGNLQKNPHHVWSLEDTVAIAFEPGQSQFALSHSQRVVTNRFAQQLGYALGVQLALARGIVAQLFHVKDWETLVGEHVDLVPVRQPLYAYVQRPDENGDIKGVFEPTCACRWLTAELQAMAHLRAPEIQLDIAERALLPYPGLMAGAELAAQAAYALGQVEVCASVADAALRALEPLLSDRPAPMDARFGENQRYLALRFWSVVSLERSAGFDATNEHLASLAAWLGSREKTAIATSPGTIR